MSNWSCVARMCRISFHIADPEITERFNTQLSKKQRISEMDETNTAAKCAQHDVWLLRVWAQVGHNYDGALCWAKLSLSQAGHNFDKAWAELWLLHGHKSELVTNIPADLWPTILTSHRSHSHYFDSYTRLDLSSFSPDDIVLVFQIFSFSLEL